LISALEAYGQEVLSSSYNQELYLKITSLSKQNLKEEEYIQEFE